jgi:hypothetical protein
MTFTIGSIFLSLALIALVALFLARPWLTPGEKPAAVTRLEALTNQKEALLAQIRLLDFDHEVGVIPDEEHQRLRLRLVSDTAAVMQQLDALPQPAKARPAKAQPAPARTSSTGKAKRPAAVPSTGKAGPAVTGKAKPAISPPPAAPEGDLDAAIEVAVAKLRRAKDSSLQDPAVNGTILTCPQCDREVKADDRFCAGCGQPINQPSHI